MSMPDWSLMQSFLAVAETGSLSAGARASGHSQPTLGRHIQTLERALGASLFERHARGLTLSDTGTTLLPLARQMRAAMNQITLAVSRDDFAVRCDNQATYWELVRGQPDPAHRPGLGFAGGGAETRRSIIPEYDPTRPILTL